MSRDYRAASVGARACDFAGDVATWQPMPHGVIGIADRQFGDSHLAAGEGCVDIWVHHVTVVDYWARAAR